MIRFTRSLIRRNHRAITRSRYTRQFSDTEGENDKKNEEQERMALLQNARSKEDHLTSLIKYEKKKARSEHIQERRDNLLFEKYLSEEEIVPIYDVTNIAYPARAYRDFGMFVGFQILSIPFYAVTGFKFIPFHLLGSAIILRSHFRFCRDFVEKIDFDPISRKFYFQKRKMITGSFDLVEVGIDDVLYTSDPVLNKDFGINYINMETLDTYSIVYKNGWINLDLFSYLLRQNLQTDFVEGSRDTY